MIYNCNLVCKLTLPALVLLLWAHGRGDSLAQELRTESKQRVSFAWQIRPILARQCFACHGPDESTREAGLALHRPELMFAESDSGEPAIIPGQPQQSPLMMRISSDDDGERMPPADHAPPLSNAEIELIRRWIAEGAEYESHWAYQHLASPAIPNVSQTAWPYNEIDFFLLAEMESHGLAPSQPASREVLLRRVSLDLTGLPPSLAEQQAFLDDTSPSAYERAVDRLLASPAYGEHWARLWLDLARYADSQGYAQDEIRSIWKYRDWLIESLNDDMPFDRFTIEQLAGDLLPNPTTSQLVATGFHRNTMTNTEGGTDDEEFRHAAIVDRVNTTGTVWLATTFACAQCHTHKYDPVSLKEYYQLYALFNQTADNDQPDNSPVLELWTDEQSAERQRITAEILKLKSPPSDAADTPPEQAAALAELERQLAAIKPVTTPILRDLPPDKRRMTRIALGGVYPAHGDVVEPGVPAALNASGIEPTNRLEFAKWLVADANPLTPRVIVNRQWEQFFGRGLVPTNHDFGTQGELPSHPQLLDWLAADFRRNGWSLKRLCKRIVMSHAYRQSSVVSSQALAADRDTRWLSRGARFRLSAEALRDYALATSGLLSTKMFGPPVRPPQPTSGLRAAFGESLDWSPSEGEDRYRRGLYTLWRRVYPYPSLMALDATNRTTCTAQRMATNTPVAAFVTLNDPAFFECAQALGRRAVAQPGEPAERIRYLFRTVVCRQPNDDELQTLAKLQQWANAQFRLSPEQARELCGTMPDADAESTDWTELASWIVVANTLLNLDEVLTRN